MQPSDLQSEEKIGSLIKHNKWTRPLKLLEENYTGDKVRTCSLSSLTSVPSLFTLAAPSSTVATRSANLSVLIDSPIASGSGLM